MTRFAYQNKKTQTKIRRPRFGKIRISVVTANVAVLSIIAVGAVAYLVQINGLATKGYQIRELETQITQLRQENNQLEVQALDLQSMDNVKNKVTQLNMVPTGKADYLSGGSSFAVNR